MTCSKSCPQFSGASPFALEACMFLPQMTGKRRGWDSNPRDGLTPPTRFPVALLRPTRTPLLQTPEEFIKSSPQRALTDPLCRRSGGYAPHHSGDSASNGPSVVVSAGAGPPISSKKTARADVRRTSGFSIVSSAPE
jgi:hypothetical protein